MTQNNRETMQRAMGLLEGVSFVVPDNIQEALIAAIEMLNAVYDEETQNDR